MNLTTSYRPPPATVRVRRKEFTRLTPAQVRTQAQTALPRSE